MKIYCRNHIALNDICVMLNDIYGNDHRFDNYLVIIDFAFLTKEMMESLKRSGYYLVVYDLEHIKDNPWYFQDFEDRLSLKKIHDYADEIWTYTLTNKEYLLSIGYKNVKFRPVIYTDKLKSPNISLLNNPPIDVLFYGNLTDRRVKLFQKIEKEKMGRFSFDFIHATPKSVLDWKIANSKIILNCKSYDVNYNQEIVRIFYPLINDKCVLSEESECDNYAGNNIVYFNWDNVTEKIIKLLIDNNYKNYENKGLNFKNLCESGDIYHTSEV